MSSLPSVKLSFGPLFKASGCIGATHTAYVPNNFGTGGPAHEQTFRSEMETFAGLVGINRRTAWRWKKDGIPIGVAEDLAFALGSHPAVVWGDEWLFCAGCPLAKVAATFSPVNPQRYAPIRRTDVRGK